jgi:hypothetical protein
LAGKVWYSVMDLRYGYWNVKLADSSRHFTDVKTVEGLAQYYRMKRGLKTAPEFFQRVVNKAYEGLKGNSPRHTWTTSL